VLDFLYVEKLWKLDHDFMCFSQHSAAHEQKWPDFYFQSNYFTPNLKCPLAVSYSNTKVDEN